TDPTPYLLTGPRSLAVKSELLAPALDPAKFAAPPDPKNPKAPPAFNIPDSEYLQPGDSSGWVPIGQVLDALHDCKWHPQALYRKAAEGVHLELEFALPDGKGGLKSIKKITVKGKPNDTTFEMPANLAANPELAKALQERFWLPTLRTQRE